MVVSVISMTARCRSCQAELRHVMIDLGPQPPGDLFLEPHQLDQAEPMRPLRALVCDACWLAQLGSEADGFSADPPATIESDTARAHAADTVAALIEDLGLARHERVHEVASHHGGSLLPHFAERRFRPGQPADVVIDNHALPHAAGFDAHVASLAAALAPGGTLCLELHHLLPLVEGSQFDTIRHGHFSYVSLLALVAALERHGLAATDAEPVPMYGGSLRVLARAGGVASPSVTRVLAAERAAGLDGLEAFCRFAAAASEARDAIERFFDDRPSVLGYGAPSKAVTLLTWCGVGPDALP